MNTIKNIFRKYPITSLSITNFVAVWLLPLFVMIGFNIKALWGGMVNFGVGAPIVWQVYSNPIELINVAYKVIFAGASHAGADPFWYYAFLVAPLFAILIIWMKKKITGIMTVKDIFLLVLFSVLAPQMYIVAYIYTNTFMQLGGF